MNKLNATIFDVLSTDAARYEASQLDEVLREDFINKAVETALKQINPTNTPMEYMLWGAIGSCKKSYMILIHDMRRPRLKFQKGDLKFSVKSSSELLACDICEVNICYGASDEELADFKQRIKYDENTHTANIDAVINYCIFNGIPMVDLPMVDLPMA